MIRLLTAIILLIATVPTSSSHGQTPDFELITLLSKHEFWISATIQDNAFQGMPTQQVLKEIKKWKFSKEGSAGVLNETTQTSIGTNCDEFERNPERVDFKNLFFWKSGKIRLDQFIRITDLHFNPEWSLLKCKTARADNAEAPLISRLSRDRFILIFPKAKIQILFFPSNTAAKKKLLQGKET